MTIRTQNITTDDIKNITISKLLHKGTRAEVATAIIKKQITLEDARLLALSNIQFVYNTLVIALENRGINNFSDDIIIYRETINDILALEAQRYNDIYDIFNTLKKIGIIGVCGTGYILNYNRLIISTSDWQRIEEIEWHIL